MEVPLMVNLALSQVEKMDILAKEVSDGK